MPGIRPFGRRPVQAEHTERNQNEGVNPEVEIIETGLGFALVVDYNKFRDTFRKNKPGSRERERRLKNEAREQERNMNKEALEQKKQQ